MKRKAFNIAGYLVLAVFLFSSVLAVNLSFGKNVKNKNGVIDAQNDSSKTQLKKQAKNDKPKSDSPTIITSDGPLDVNFEQNMAVFHDNVVVKDNRGEVYADLMKVFFKKDNKDISLIEAIGNVVIHMDNKIAKSDKAVYKVDAGLLELTGNPKIQEDKNIYAADKITIFQKDGKSQMKLEPKAKLLLYREGAGKDGALF